ncbi:FG-GAP repeat protein [Engelhardtia mirabilis]|uniref:FG-GAP repeat protein n=1 Tax=Engelhardtia mirabilis TaxID=2528011 RepID=A0A518BQX9_9BACT|nr:FG-GAP repeat protein [Planctomycetes bacterium Pla133]QDV03682.1 FG-GAP repeat protein [Planctomycetes bacterium Pla86]
MSPHALRTALKPIRRLALTAGLIAGLCACSGGGGGGEASPPAIPTPFLVFASPVDGALSPGNAVLVRIVVDDIADPVADVALLLDGAPAPITLKLVGSTLTGQMLLDPGAHSLRAEFAGPPVIADEVNLWVPSAQGSDPAGDDDELVQGPVSTWSAPLFTILGPTPTADLGRALAALGDVDGDGREDFAVGVSMQGGDGRVQFRSGTTGELLFEAFGAPGDRFGSALAPVADVNGDGVRELIVGAPDAGPDKRGAAILLSGVDGTELWRTPGPSISDHLGTSVDGLGDVDGDGVADVVVGARLSIIVGINGGRALVLSGVDGSVLHDVQGEMAFVQVGTDVASAGDYDGDGRADFVVGSWGSWDNGPASGAATIYSGRDGSQLGRVAGPVADDHLGASIDFADDLNGDGVPDLLCGAPFAGDAALLDVVGEVHAFDGATLEPLWIARGPQHDSQFGRELVAIDDIDGDGANDVLVGAPFDLHGQGSLHVLSGSTGLQLERRTGPAVVGFFGTTCARLGDLDRDGRAEWGIGAPGLSLEQFLAGGAFIYTAGSGEMTPPVDVGVDLGSAAAK